jgi:uracil-DNA glycosylase
MTVASDTVATAKRIDKLGQYMAEHVLGPSGKCVCPRLGSCRRSVLGGRHAASQPDAAFAAGQLSHVGHHFDLVVNGVPTRTLVIAMETGRAREGVTLKERHAEVMQCAGLAFSARNPHMRGVTSALRLAVGRDPGADRDGEHLRLEGARSPVHLFDAYAMANMRLCSAVVNGTTKSLGNATMSRNCAPHMAATISILEPTLCIVQGVEVYKALTALMSRRRQIAPHLEQARIAGVDTLVAAFTHPSAMRLTDHWGRLTSAPYLYGTVVPTIKAAHQLVTKRGVQTGKVVGPQRRPGVIDGQPPG